MADIGANYVLTAPGGTINFNTGQLKDGTDKYWIQTVTGLDGAPVRVVTDKVPFGDGGIPHTFWLDARHPVFEGVIVPETVGFPIKGPECVERQNEMEDALRAALDSMYGTATGTLTWTPSGLGARSLTVKTEIPLECAAIEEYAVKQFTFGLYAADPTW